MSNSERTYGGRSGAERVEERRRAFVDAALDVAAELGWRQVTVDRVSERARLSKRYFYESFSNVDAVAEAVVVQVATELIAAVVIAPGRPDDVPALARATLATVVHHLTDDPRRARVLFGDLAMTEASAAHRAAAIKLIATSAVATARGIHEAPTVQDPMIETAAAVLIGGTGQAILSWIAGDLPGDRDDLVENLATLWVITGDGTAAEIQARLDRAAD